MPTDNNMISNPHVHQLTSKLSKKVRMYEYNFVKNKCMIQVKIRAHNKYCYNVSVSEKAQNHSTSKSWFSQNDFFTEKSHFINGRLCFLQTQVFMLIIGLESCLLTYYDGTHSMQSEQVMQCLISPNLFRWRNKLITPYIAWGWVHFQLIFIFWWTVSIMH